MSRKSRGFEYFLALCLIVLGSSSTALAASGGACCEVGPKLARGPEVIDTREVSFRTRLRESSEPLEDAIEILRPKFDKVAPHVGIVNFTLEAMFIADCERGNVIEVAVAYERFLSVALKTTRERSIRENALFTIGNNLLRLRERDEALGQARSTLAGVLDVYQIFRGKTEWHLNEPQVLTLSQLLSDVVQKSKSATQNETAYRLLVEVIDNRSAHDSEQAKSKLTELKSGNYVESLQALLEFCKEQDTERIKSTRTIVPNFAAGYPTKELFTHNLLRAKFQTHQTVVINIDRTHFVISSPEKSKGERRYEFIKVNEEGIIVAISPLYTEGEPYSDRIEGKRYLAYDQIAQTVTITQRVNVIFGSGIADEKIYMVQDLIAGEYDVAHNYMHMHFTL